MKAKTVLGAIVALTILFVFQSLSAQTLFAQTLYDGLTNGNYAVGFRTWSVEDYSRNSWSGDERRVIQLSIWYPAAKTKQTTTTAVAAMEYMKVADYISAVSRSDENLLTSDEATKKSRLERFKQERSRADSAKVLSLLSMPTRAYLNATPTSEKYPVLFALASGGAPHSWHIMAEFLASYGYVVVSLPMPSDFTILTSPLIDNGCALDVQFAINKLSELPYADISQIGIIGYSAGSVRGALVQMQSSRVKVVVSLEGSEGNNGYWANFRSHPAFDVGKITVPYAALYGTPSTRSWFNGFHFYDGLPIHSYRLVEIPGLLHNAIGSWSVYNRFAPIVQAGSSTVPNPGSEKDAFEIQSFLHNYTLHFMQAHLRNIPSSVQFINQTAQQNNLPENRYVLRKSTEKSMLKHAMDLLAFGKIDEAKAMLRQCIASYPNSLEPKIALAEVFIAVGQKNEAIPLVEAVLAQDPQNKRAIGLKARAF